MRGYSTMTSSKRTIGLGMPDEDRLRLRTTAALWPAGVEPSGGEPNGLSPAGPAFANGFEADDFFAAGTVGASPNGFEAEAAPLAASFLPNGFGLNPRTGNAYRLV